jgi:D-cysteine desulfhydrase family pyridoxal phosphate-dependent enzyme
MEPIPRLKFAHLPTPIEELPRLSAHLGGPRIYVKRDDLTGLAFGGNKTRKLEFLVAEALEQGAKMLITGGAAQSNHCRQTAAAAAKFGLECMLVLSGTRPERPSANLLLDYLLDADVVWVERREERDPKLEEIYETARASGRQPYLVPYGGSSPTGALGYAFAVQEFMEQGIQADWMVFASSSGGTQAGLVLGQRAFGFSGRVLGISIDEPETTLQAQAAKIASAASEKLGERLEFDPAAVLVNADYCAAGYGILGLPEKEAVELFAEYEGLLLDPVYTGRAAAGMIDLIRKGFFQKDETVLFWHTGGHPALFADKYSGDIL